MSLNSGWRMTFCSTTRNLWVRSLSLSSLRFILTIVKALSRPLEVPTLAQDVEDGVIVACVGTDVTLNRVIAYWR